MTFLPISGNLRKVCALDVAQLRLCMKKSQLLDSLMNKRLSFPLKRCGSESSSISFFFFLFNLLVCSSLFLVLCIHGYIFFNLTCVYSTNTHVETRIISTSRNVITLCTLAGWVVTWFLLGYTVRKNGGLLSTPMF